jgi:iron complex outermembrane receptor protein
MRRVGILIFSLLTLCIHSPATGAPAGAEDFEEISLDSLLNTRISAAAKYEQTTGEAPASVTVVTWEDIDRYGYRTLEDVFRSVRGFYVSNDRNYSYVGVRGFSRPTDYNNRILILINGQILNEPFYSSAVTGTEFPINMDSIERIEIVRGPGSALYGTSAMFALVNIVTKKSNVFEGARISAEAGSFETYGTQAVYVKELAQGIDLAVSGKWADSGGQDLYFEEYDRASTNHGIAEGLNWDRSHSLLATLDYGRFRFQGLTFSREKGIPTGAFDTPFNYDGAKTRDGQTLLQAAYEREIGPGKNVSIRLSYDHYRYRGTYPYENGEADPSIIDSFDSNDTDRLGTEFQYRWDIRSNNRLTVGTDYQNIPRAEYKYWDQNTTFFDGDFPYSIFSLYLQDDFQALRNLSFLGGVRWDRYSTVGSTVTPRAALLYHLRTSSTLKFLYGEAFRAPTLYELYYIDSLGGWRPSEDLEPERLRTIELVWEQRLSEGLFGLVSFYNNMMSDLIDSSIDPADSSGQFRNVSEVHARGVEFELTLRPASGIRGYASYVFQRAEDRDSGRKLTNCPSHIVKLGFSLPLLRHFYGSAEFLYETDRITLYDTRTDPYLLTNLTLSTRKVAGHLSLSLQARNLFDVEYGTPGGYEHVQDIIMQDGRAFIVRLEYR